MQAVVSLLDDHHTQLTEALWRELETQFGLRGVYTTPHPHFSYHVARSYDLDSLVPRLDRLIHATRPFQVKTTGLGVFTGKSPVLYHPGCAQPGADSVPSSVVVRACGVRLRQPGLLWSGAVASAYHAWVWRHPEGSSRGGCPPLGRAGLQLDDHD